MPRRWVPMIPALAASVLAWFLAFHLVGPDDTGVAQVLGGCALIVLADTWAIRRVRTHAVLLTTWLPVALLGAWSFARASSMGGVGAVVWMVVTAIFVPLAWALAIPLHLLVAWSSRRLTSSWPGPTRDHGVGRHR